MIKRRTYILTISYFFGILLFFDFVSAGAQTNKDNKGVIHPSQERHATLSGVVDLVHVNSNFNPVLQSIEIEDHSNDGDSLTTPVMLPRQPGNFQEDVPSGSENKMSSTPTPVIISEFSGLSDNAYTPPDDNIAVSNGGYIITTINSIYRIFQPNSTKPYKSFGFYDALKSTFPSITGVYYDPRVIYDAEDDRFIVVVLNGTTSTTSNIVILFSKDNNPADGWNAYSISGDIFGNSEWADYDNIGLSKDDLFLTNNLFDDDQNYQEPSILQISKSTGYNGSTLAYRSWQPESSDLFTPVPVPDGLGGDYGDTMFFVTNKFQGGTAVTLLKIDGKESDSNSSLSTSVLSYKTLTAHSPVSSGGSQKSSSNTLNEGDTRIKQAFYLNGIIHYVFTTKDQTTGNSDIVYARLNIASNSVTYKQLGLTDYDYVYPSIASYGANYQDKSVLIGYCRTGDSLYPEVDAVECDSDFNFSSSLNIHLGVSAVNGNTSEQRWGDYTGMARQYNSANCYFSGSYGSGNAFQTGIAEIGPQSSGINENYKSHEMNMSVFPNPVTDIYTLKFNLQQKSHINISIVDMQGRHIVQLFDGTPPPGDETFSFNKAALSPGIYSLVIAGDNSMVIAKKIVVEN